MGTIIAMGSAQNVVTITKNEESEKVVNAARIAKERRFRELNIDMKTHERIAKKLNSVAKSIVIHRPFSGEMSPSVTPLAGPPN
jgi:hypothetical protein